MTEGKKFNIVSLGCARNLVDSEVMAGLLHQSGYELVQTPEAADVVLVNTCGFIEAAKTESIDTILEISRLKQEGQLKKLIVAGCLAQRYPEDLAKELPEVDLFIGTGEVPRVPEILLEQEAKKKRRLYVGLPSYLYDEQTPRIRTGPSHTAFLKASEGCDHKCSFCIIPQLRGPHRSRSIASVVAEAEQLAAGGVKEINLIAQDLTAYGRDRRDGTTLAGLLRELTGVTDVRWIRLLYAYPNFLDQELLELIAGENNICRYIDIPLQHASRSLLQKMRRGKSGSAVREAVQKLRTAIPGVTLRTSMIVGFPGETEDDFRQLLDFVKETRFERLGVFKYSEEESTAAAAMGEKVPEMEKERRWQELMELQSGISLENNQALIGSIQQVMIDGTDLNGGRFEARTQAHAPEVDGLVYIEAAEGGEVEPYPGDIVNVRITGASDYDLTSEIVYG
ncbi:MAG TPA: 30S ribosomal protein S12 methylthiotransferase RimO [Candidatus Binatia bacterium]|jgi:ribosomal protein S12 methylthiotransferase